MVLPRFKGRLNHLKTLSQKVLTHQVVGGAETLRSPHVLSMPGPDMEGQGPLGDCGVGVGRSEGGGAFPAEDRAQAKTQGTKQPRLGEPGKSCS